MRFIKIAWLVAILFVGSTAFCQTTVNTNGSVSPAIITAVPFLTITPDARAGGLGESGAATTPDVNANYWNPSKLAFIDNDLNVSLSYSPWLRKIVPGVYLSYLSFAKKVDDRNTLGVSLRYFNLGTSVLYDQDQNTTGLAQPNEYSIDASLARKFGGNFSLGLTFRYIHSNVTSGLPIGGQASMPGNAETADVSFYYKTNEGQTDKDDPFAFGIDISNIGTKITYTYQGQGYFLPTNLRIGAAKSWYWNDESHLTLALDMNKLLVPTPPIRDNNGNIIKGKDDNISVPAGIFSSFTDAPGGFSEELQEINISPALEYSYDKFAIRAGYFYNNPNNGNRQYLTLGLGLKFKDMNLDFSYIAANQQNSPLANTIRLTVGYAVGNNK